jgi:cytoskeleton protein RodZ
VDPPAPNAKPAAAAPAQATPAGLPPPAVATAPVTDKPAKSAKANALRFEPSQDAWIQVVDGKGNRFSKLVRAGTAESFTGEPPFRLVVGEAAKVRMSFNGHVIDLTPFIGQKVARLTLE